MPALIALLGCLAGSPAGCHAGRAAEGEVVVLIESPAQTIDPRYALGAYDFKLSRLVYAPLVSADDPNLTAHMELAESVVIESPTVYLVTLRDAHFSDGKPVTAEDVVYTYESIRAPGSRSPRLLRLRDNGLTTVEAVDSRHVRFTLAHPHAPFLTDLDIGIVERPQATAKSDDLSNGQPDHPPLGAGPFALESADHERWRFVPNAHYAFGAPTIKKLIVKVIRDDNSRLLALVGGSADLTQNTVSPLLIDAVSKQPRLRVQSARSSVYTYMGLNCDDPILRDVRVRQAIAYAIDRERIIATKLGGRAVLSTGMLPPFHWAYAAPPDDARYPYDPAKARALLDEAGFRDPDGDGPLPRFTLIYKTSSNRFRVALAQVLVAQLAEVGIAVDLRPLEFATFFADVKAGNFQMFTMQIPEVAEPHLYMNFFASKSIPTHDNPDVGGNRARFRSEELDRWIEKGRGDIDLAARKADYSEVQAILAREVPVVSLWHEDNVVVTSDAISGFDILPTAQMTSLARVKKARP